jgi:putative PIN family toxin of toxin-antitoxin system
MVNIILDTNIVVSAALSPQGNPAKIIRLLEDSINKDIKLYHNPIIIAEYKKVLSYKRLNIPSEEQEQALAAIQELGETVVPAKSDIPLPDESDRIFFDTAKACNAYLITGNIKHYPDEPFVLTPAQFIDMLAK